jgi:4'-phosphopantetheinyl transferase
MHEVERQVAFCRCWTRKEAYIKAVSRGLSILLDQFDVSLAPEMPAAFNASREDPQAVNSWLATFAQGQS